jgi:hypothetical protein
LSVTISDYVFTDAVRRVFERAVEAIERHGYAGVFREP